uniref:Uncharacterized protein n=1 Tax=Acrobeloides nanus TaxID=290746 RepID=A0A914BWH5_9BILA
MPIYYFWLLIILTKLISITYAKLCYSCAGTCHSETCNCQMGICEADYCFIEKKPTDLAGIFRITKGCLKRPPRIASGCDYDHFPDHVQCICSGDFCNDAIHMKPHIRKSISCKKCPEKDPDCGRTCTGQWCHEDTTSGATGCGYGPPSLPFFYKSHDLLSTYRPKICITLSRGANSQPHRHCICNTPMCNDQHKNVPFIPVFGPAPVSGGPQPRSLPYQNPYQEPKFYNCVSCDVTSQDSTMTSACKQHTCKGHFCTYAAQRIVINGMYSKLGPQAIIHEKQGCINVTDSHKIQHGCTHKWMSNEEEELLCACSGEQCNKDLSTASASFASTTSQNLHMLKFLFLYFLLKFLL